MVPYLLSLQYETLLKRLSIFLCRRVPIISFRWVSTAPPPHLEAFFLGDRWKILNLNICTGAAGSGRGWVLLMSPLTPLEWDESMQKQYTEITALQCCAVMLQWQGSLFPGSTKKSHFNPLRSDGRYGEKFLWGQLHPSCLVFLSHDSDHTLQQH